MNTPEKSKRIGISSFKLPQPGFTLVITLTHQNPTCLLELPEITDFLAPHQTYPNNGKVVLKK